MKAEKPTGPNREVIALMTSDFTQRCAHYVNLLKSKGINHQQACSLVGSACMSAACGSMQAMASGMGIPYTSQDGDKFASNLQAVVAAEDNRLRALYTGAVN